MQDHRFLIQRAGFNPKTFLIWDDKRNTFLTWKSNEPRYNGPELPNIREINLQYVRFDTKEEAEKYIEGMVSRTVYSAKREIRIAGD